MRSIVSMFVMASFCVGCAATGTEGQSQMAAASAEEQGAVSEPGDVAAPDGAAAPQEEKQSLDKMLDEHDTVTLKDDETGETKLICKREPISGSRLAGRKVCATRKQWDDRRQESQENVGDLQRGLRNPGSSN